MHLAMKQLVSSSAELAKTGERSTLPLVLGFLGLGLLLFLLMIYLKKRSQ